MSAYRSFYAAGYNSAPVKSVGQLFEALDRGKVIDPVASTRMLDIMLDCHTGEARIRAGLPAGVLLAHKTGTQLKRVCDLGMFYKPDMQSVVFTACLEEFGSRKKAEKLLASLATSTYRLVTRPVRERPAVSEKTRALESAPPEAVTRLKQAPETTVMPEIPLVPITP